MVAPQLQQLWKARGQGMARREKGEPRILFYADWLPQSILSFQLQEHLLLSSGNLLILLQTTEHWGPVAYLNPVLNPCKPQRTEGLVCIPTLPLIHLGNPCNLYVLGFLSLRGEVGIANVQLFYAGQAIFSSFHLLYRVEEGWLANVQLFQETMQIPLTLASLA